MSLEELFGTHVMRAVVAAGFALALAVVPLAGCSSSTAADEGGEAQPAPETQPVAADPTSWQTLGDAFATQTAPLASSYDDSHYACVFEAGNSYYRVTAELDAATLEALSNLEPDPENIFKGEQEVLANVKLLSAEDITADRLTEDQVAQLVGKTGQELIDDGFAFESYFMYGGEQTAADFAKGYFTYGITFDVQVDESAADDEGASLMDATAVEADYSSIADAAVDPSLVG